MRKTDKLALKWIWKCRGLGIAKTIWENATREFIPPEMETNTDL